MKKQTNFIRIVAFLFIAFSAIGLMAQESSLDDEGNANTPLTNSRANACYTGGLMAETCVTHADWECGWALIRFEYGVLPRESVPSTCASLLPAAPIFAGQSQDHVSGAPEIVRPNPGPIEPTAVPPVRDCYFVWARQDMPELSARVKRDLEAAGLTGVSVRVVAMGEDCISYATGKLEYFGASQTDFDITVSAPDLSNETVQKILMPKIMDVLYAIPSQDLAAPGRRLGEKHITFISPTGEIRKI